jgi:hypothetical protein
MDDVSQPARLEIARVLGLPLTDFTTWPKRHMHTPA